MSDLKLNCPHCAQSLEAPAELLGQTVPCPSCQRPIELKKSVPPPAVPVEAPPATPAQATKNCPFCGEQILAVAKKCKHCGEFLDEKNAPVTRTAQPPKIELSDLPPYYQQEFKRILESGERYKGKWNWAAFLFGPLWAMTKELWLSVAVCFVAGLVTAGIGWIVYWFVYGLRGNYLYYTLHVKKTQLWGGGGSSPPPVPAPTPVQRAAVVGAPVAARKHESAASASGMQTLGKSIGRWYWKGIGRQPVAIQVLAGVAILAILGFAMHALRPDGAGGERSASDRYVIHMGDKPDMYFRELGEANNSLGMEIKWTVKRYAKVQTKAESEKTMQRMQSIAKAGGFYAPLKVEPAK